MLIVFLADVINDVFKIDFTIPDEFNQKDVRTVYYTLQYGIIAYELINGVVVELDEKFIK